MIKLQNIPQKQIFWTIFYICSSPIVGEVSVRAEGLLLFSPPLLRDSP